MACKLLKTYCLLLPLILIHGSNARRVSGSLISLETTHCIPEDYFDLAFCCDIVNDTEKSTQINTEAVERLKTRFSEVKSSIQGKCDKVLMQMTLKLSDSLQKVPVNELEGYVEKLKIEEEEIDSLRLKNNMHEAFSSQIETRLDTLAEELKSVMDLKKEITQQMNDKLAASLDDLMSKENETQSKLGVLKESLNELEKSISTLSSRWPQAESDLQVVGNILDNLCLPPFAWQGDGCYYVPYLEKTWHEARNFCQGLDADLAVPRDYLPFVKWLASLNLKNDMWVGASDIVEEDRWVWITGEPLDIKPSEFFRWKIPTEKEDEDCLEICSHFGYRPTDMKCTEENYFVCQKPIGILDPIVAE